MYDDKLIAELEHRHDVTAAARAVAEDLGWPMAYLFGVVIQEWAQHWWISVPAGIAFYFLVTRRYCKAEEAAEDAAHKASGSGKYYHPS